MSVGPNPMAVKRLRQDLMDMENDPTPGQWAKPDPANIMKWYYCIKGPKDTPYEGGYYVGHLLFPKDYPFKGPEIYMLTPNGRLTPGRKLCLSISSYHPETWSPMWGPRTIINGISSFMVEESHGIGSVRESNERRLAYAKNSGMWNKKNFKEFHEFFPEALGEILDKEDSGKSNAGSSKPKPTSSQNTDLKKNKDARINTKAPAPPRVHQPRVTTASPIEVIPAAVPKRVRPKVQQAAIVIDSDDENAPPALQINPPKKLKNDDVIVID